MNNKKDYTYYTGTCEQFAYTEYVNNLKELFNRIRKHLSLKPNIRFNKLPHEKGLPKNMNHYSYSNNYSRKYKNKILIALPEKD